MNFYIDDPFGCIWLVCVPSVKIWVNDGHPMGGGYMVEQGLHRLFASLMLLSLSVCNYFAQ